MTISTETFLTVGVGTTSNDGTGDPLRTAFEKVNANFDAITSVGFDAGNINAAGSIEAQGNITARGTMFIGTDTPISFANCALNAVSSANSYSQLNIQNTSTEARASSDLIATTSDGTDTTGFIDVGINGSGYSVSSWTISGARDGYVYVNGGNLTLGTETASKTVKVHVGGTTSSNVVTTFDSSAVTMAANLVLANLGRPATSSSTGTVGQVAFDSGNIYICVATNTWRRANLSTF